MSVPSNAPPRAATSAPAMAVIHPVDLSAAPGLCPAVRDALQLVGDDADAQAVTRRLTRSHYENFSVVSFLLPRHLRQDFCNVYAFCRIADDLGDEVGDKNKSLDYLAAFRRQFQRCCTAAPRSAPPTHLVTLSLGHLVNDPAPAVFTALSQTIRRHDIPLKPFDDLIRAFEQDQVVSRYQSFKQLVDYCTRSADPVGRIVLYMCGYRDEARQRLSDRTCTALQLINFWQDVRRDILERDRIYLPAEDMQRFGVTETQLREGRVTQSYRDLIRFQLERTEKMFDEGDALLPLLASAYRRQIALFSKGGRAICAAVRRQNFDTLSSRPHLSKWQKVRLISATLVGSLLGLGGKPAAAEARR